MTIRGPATTRGSNATCSPAATASRCATIARPGPGATRWRSNAPERTVRRYQPPRGHHQEGAAMIQLDSSQGYVAVFAIALVFGILGGLAAEFLLNRNGETGTFELPRRDGRLFDFGGFANLFVGGVTGIAILLVFPPTSVTIQGASGAGATVVSVYDPIRLAVTALV